MIEEHIKKTIYKRIESLFNCQNGEQLFTSMVQLQQELEPGLPEAIAQSFVVYGIIKEFEDYELDQLWFLHLIEKGQDYQEQAA